jgi:HK97 gp10 family phage protein
MDIELIDNSPMVKRAFEEACLRALERCGMQAEGYAKENITAQKAVDTGNLRNSISHKVDPSKKCVYIGSNVEYAPYVELGTGKFADDGRKDSWVYQDTEGKWHHTNGQRARPYLKPAVADHKQTYRNIIKDALKNA